MKDFTSDDKFRNYTMENPSGRKPLMNESLKEVSSAPDDKKKPAGTLAGKFGRVVEILKAWILGLLAIVMGAGAIRLAIAVSKKKVDYHGSFGQIPTFIIVSLLGIGALWFGVYIISHPSTCRSKHSSEVGKTSYKPR